MSLYDAFETELGDAPRGVNTSVNHSYEAGQVTDEQIAAFLELHGCEPRPTVVSKNRRGGNPMRGDWQSDGVGLTIWDSGKVATRGAAI